MSQNENEKSTTQQNPISVVGWISLGTVAGFVAFHLLKRGKEDIVEKLDREKILNACDSAAKKLDELLGDETSSQTA